MGDLNARVGRQIPDSESDFGDQLSDTVGPWSLKGDIVANENGALLLDMQLQIIYVMSHHISHCVTPNVRLGGIQGTAVVFMPPQHAIRLPSSCCTCHIDLD